MKSITRILQFYSNNYKQQQGQRAVLRCRSMSVTKINVKFLVTLKFTDHHHDVSILIQNTHQVYSCHCKQYIYIACRDMIVFCTKAGTTPAILSKYTVSPMQWHVFIYLC